MLRINKTYNNKNDEFINICNSICTDLQSFTEEPVNGILTFKKFIADTINEHYCNIRGIKLLKLEPQTIIKQVRSFFDDDAQRGFTYKTNKFINYSLVSDGPLRNDLRNKLLELDVKNDDITYDYNHNVSIKMGLYNVRMITNDEHGLIIVTKRDENNGRVTDLVGFMYCEFVKGITNKDSIKN